MASSKDKQLARIMALHEGVARLEAALTRLGFWTLPAVPDHKGESVRPSVIPVVALICAALPYKEAPSLFRSIGLRNRCQHAGQHGGEAPSVEEAVGAIVDYRDFLSALCRHFAEHADRELQEAEEPLAEHLRLHGTLRKRCRRFGLSLTNEEDFIASVARLSKAARVHLEADIRSYMQGSSSLARQARWVFEDMIFPGLLLGMVNDLTAQHNGIAAGAIGVPDGDVRTEMNRKADHAVHILMRFASTRIDIVDAIPVNHRLQSAKAHIVAYLEHIERVKAETDAAHDVSNEKRLAMAALLDVARAEKTRS